MLLIYAKYLSKHSFIHSIHKLINLAERGRNHGWPNRSSLISAVSYARFISAADRVPPFTKIFCETIKSGNFRGQKRKELATFGQTRESWHKNSQLSGETWHTKIQVIKLIEISIMIRASPQKWTIGRGYQQHFIRGLPCLAKRTVGTGRTRYIVTS